MRKISAMYEWSGGMDYRHTCGECKNCIRVQAGKRTVLKCMSYCVSASPASDWNANSMACRAFDRSPPKIPVSQSDFEGGNRITGSEIIQGQMTIFDFLK